jgi:hypothetical protein
LSAWLQGSGFGPGIQFFLAVDLTLIACYAYLAWVAAAWLRVQATAPSGETARDRMDAGTTSGSNAPI